MTQETLPAGSLPYGNQYFVDPDERVWFGNAFDKYTTRIDLYVNIKDHGAAGDGIADDTAAFHSALAQTKIEKKVLFIPDGVYNITPEVSTVDCSGCLGFIGYGTLSFSPIEDDEPLLLWQGSVELIGSGVATSAGDQSTTIDPEKNINLGDTVFLISNEKIAGGNVGPNYVKGQRLSVSEYNPVTGLLSFFDTMDEDIASGYLYLNTIRPKIILSGVTIECSEMKIKRGIEVVFAEIVVKDLTINNFARVNLLASQSRAHISNYRSVSRTFPGSTTSYGIQAGGLTYMEVYDACVMAGRHALQTGDRGTFKADMAGGGSPDEIYLSSVCKVFGGEFSSDSAYACIDTHAGTRQLYIDGATINNGLVLGGRYDLVRNCKINQGRRGWAVTFGRGNSDMQDVLLPFGDHLFYDCELIVGDREAIWFNSQVANLKIFNCTINSLAEATVSDYPLFRHTISGDERAAYDNIEIDGLRLLAKPGTQYRVVFYKNKYFYFKNVETRYMYLTFDQSGTSDEPLRIDGLTVSDSWNTGLLIRQITSDVVLRDIYSFDNNSSAATVGIYILDCPYVSCRGIESKNNGEGLRVRGDNTTFIGSDIKSSGNTSRGLLIEANNAVNMSEYGLNGVDARGNGTGIGVINSPVELYKVATLE